MRKFAVIGLGTFGQCMLEELRRFTHDIVVIDNDPERLERCKTKVAHTQLLSVFSKDELARCLPQSITTAIVDFSEKIELSIMITTFLKSFGIKDIIVKGCTNIHQEVLLSVGATWVVLPDREASKQIVPQLATLRLFNFLPVSDTFVLAEVAVESKLVGTSLRESNLRQKENISVIAVRKKESADFSFMNDPSYCFESDDILLVAGSEDCILSFSHGKTITPKEYGTGIFQKLFPRREK